jgi:hypothetical protein
MDKKTIIKEHIRLVKVLKSGSAKDRKKEAARQAKELRELLPKGMAHQRRHFRKRP